MGSLQVTTLTRTQSGCITVSLTFNDVFIVHRLSCYGQLLKQLNVASLSRPTVFCSVTHCYCYIWANNDDDDDDDDDDDEIIRSGMLK